MSFQEGKKVPRLKKGQGEHMLSSLTQGMTPREAIVYNLLEEEYFRRHIPNPNPDNESLCRQIARGHRRDARLIRELVNKMRMDLPAHHKR